MDLIRTGKTYLVPLILLGIIWFIVTFISYGLFLGIRNVDVDMVILAVGIGIADVFALLLGCLLSSRYGRKPILISQLGITAICCFVFQFTQDSAPEGVLIAIFTIGKLCSTMAF